MGIIVVLIFYAIAFSILAATCSAILWAITRILLRKAEAGRRRALSIALLFPFICVCYAGVWFIAYSIVNNYAFHRDPGLGDGWYTPLPDGYTLEMIDITDRGVIHPSGSDLNGSDALDGIARMQLDKANIWAAADKESFGVDEGKLHEDEFFVVDTQDHSVAYFPSLDAMKDEMVRRGVQSHLEPIAHVYQKYRMTWFEYLSGAILVLIPLGGFIVLARWIWMLRAQGLNSEPLITSSDTP